MTKRVSTKKELEILLESLKGYRKPKIALEQYPIPSSLAAELLVFAYLNGDIEGKVVCDLGCGTGRLAIGASLLGAKLVYGCDVDEEALKIAMENALVLGVKNVVWIKKDVKELTGIRVDTVVQNPPFGVRKKHADIVFLRKAIEIGKVVYTIHKSGRENREFLKRVISEMGGKITHVIEKDFVIPHLYEFHRKFRHKFKVDLYRIVVGGG